MNPLDAKRLGDFFMPICWNGDMPALETGAARRGGANPSIGTLDDDEKLTYVLHRAGQNRSVNLINESGLYALVFKSKKETAKKFRKWVTKEVIPSIRKSGNNLNYNSD